MATVLCDVDEVVAALHTEWLRRYNRDWGDNLTREDIVDWSMHAFTDPDCGKGIYDYLWDTDLYDRIEPVDGAFEGVSALRELGHRVVFVTASNAETYAQKLRWLQRNGFLSQDELVAKRDYCPFGDKGMVRGDAAIDDKPQNLTDHPSSVLKILMDAPWNRDFSHPQVHRARCWMEAVRIIESALGREAA